jgi:hypothetical protein
MIKKITLWLASCGLTIEDVTKLPSNQLHQAKTRISEEFGVSYDEITSHLGKMIDIWLKHGDGDGIDPGQLVKAIESVHSGGVSGFCKRWGMEEDALRLWDRNPQQWHNVLLLGIFATVDNGDENYTGTCTACGSQTISILVDPESRVMECCNIDCGHIERHYNDAQAMLGHTIAKDMIQKATVKEMSRKQLIPLLDNLGLKLYKSAVGEYCVQPKRSIETELGAFHLGTMGIKLAD